MQLLMEWLNVLATNHTENIAGHYTIYVAGKSRAFYAYSDDKHGQWISGLFSGDSDQRQLCVIGISAERANLVLRYFRDTKKFEISISGIVTKVPAGATRVTVNVEGGNRIDTMPVQGELMDKTRVAGVGISYFEAWNLKLIDELELDELFLFGERLEIKDQLGSSLGKFPLDSWVGLTQKPTMTNAKMANPFSMLKRKSGAR